MCCEAPLRRCVSVLRGEPKNGTHENFGVPKVLNICRQCVTTTLNATINNSCSQVVTPWPAIHDSSMSWLRNLKRAVPIAQKQWIWSYF